VPNYHLYIGVIVVSAVDRGRFKPHLSRFSDIFLYSSTPEGVD